MKANLPAVAYQIPMSYMEILHLIYNDPDLMTSLIERNGWHNKWHYQNKDEIYKHSLIKDFRKRPEAYTFEYAMAKIERLDAKHKQTKLL